MQITSSGYAGAQAAPFKTVDFGVLIGFMRTTVSGIKHFTIGQSRIGGPDIIKGGGSTVTFFDKYQLTDYSAYVKSWSVDRRLGQYPFGMILAQADVQLNNTSNLFTPNFDNFVGSGTGQPNRPIKISANLGNDSFKQFTGFTGQPESSLSTRLTSLHAYDVLDYLNSTTSTASGVYVDKYFHEIMATELALQGFTSSQYVLDRSLQQKIGYYAPNGKKVGQIFKEGAEGEQGLVFVDENGIIKFWNRQHMTTISGTGLPHQFTYSNVRDIEWQNTPIINDVIVRAKPRSVQAKQPIWQLQGAFEILPGETKEYFADFVDDYGPMPVTSVDIPTSLGTTSNFTANDSSDGSGTDKASSITITDAYLFGNTYRLRIRNSFTSSVFITGLNIYGTPAKVTTVIEERYTDAPSVDQQGRNPANNGEPLVIENDIIQDKSTARSLAYTLVKEYKDPRKRLKLPIFYNPALQIGDPATVTIRETGQVLTTYVVASTMKAAGLGDVDQEVMVEERNIRQYFTIGQSKIAGTHVIAP